MQIIIHYKHLKIACRLTDNDGLEDYALHYSIARIDYVEPVHINETTHCWQIPQGLGYWHHARLENPSLFTEHFILAEFITHLTQILAKDFTFYQQAGSYVLLGRGKEDNTLFWITSDVKIQYQCQFLMALQTMLLNQDCESIVFEDFPQKETEKKENLQDHIDVELSKTEPLVVLNQLIDHMKLNIGKHSPTLQSDEKRYLVQCEQAATQLQKHKQALLTMTDAYTESTYYQDIIKQFKKEIEQAFNHPCYLNGTVYQGIVHAMERAYIHAHTIEKSHWRLKFQKKKLTKDLREQFCQIMGKDAICHEEVSLAQLSHTIAQDYQDRHDALYQRKVHIPGIRESVKVYCHHQLGHQLSLLKYLSELWQQRANELHQFTDNQHALIAPLVQDDLNNDQEIFVSSDEVGAYLKHIQDEARDVLVNPGYVNGFELPHIKYKSFRRYIGAGQKKVVVLGTISGLDLGIGNFNAIHFRFVTFNHCEIGGCYGQALSSANFSGCTFNHSELNGEFSHVDFTGASFIHVDARNAQLSASTLNSNWIYASDFPRGSLQQPHQLHDLQYSHMSSEPAPQRHLIGFTPANMSNVVTVGDDSEPSKQKALYLYAQKTLHQQEFYALVTVFKDTDLSDGVARKDILSQIAAVVNRMTPDEREKLIGPVISLLIDIQRSKTDAKQRPIQEQKNVDNFSLELDKLEEIFKGEYRELITLCKEINLSGISQYKQNKDKILSFLVDHITKQDNPDVHLILAFWEHVRDWNDAIIKWRKRNDGEIESKLHNARLNLKGNGNGLFSHLLLVIRNLQMGRKSYYKNAGKELKMALYELVSLQFLENQTSKKTKVIVLWLPVTLYKLHRLCHQWLHLYQKDIGQKQQIDELYSLATKYLTQYWPEYLIGFSIQAGDNYLPYDPYLAATHYQRGISRVKKYLPSSKFPEEINQLHQTLQQRFEQAMKPIKACTSQLQNYLESNESKQDFDDIRQFFEKSHSHRLYQETIFHYQAHQCRKLLTYLDQNYHEKRIDPNDDDLSAFRQSFARIKDQAEYDSIILAHDEKILLNQYQSSENNENVIEDLQPDHHQAVNLSHLDSQHGHWFKKHWFITAVPFAMAGILGTTPLYISAMVILGSIPASIGIFAISGFIGALLLVLTIKIGKYYYLKTKSGIQSTHVSASMDAPSDKGPEQARDFTDTPLSQDYTAEHCAEHKSIEEEHTILSNPRNAQSRKPSNREKTAEVTTNGVSNSHSKQGFQTLATGNGRIKIEHLKMKTMLLQTLKDLRIDTPEVLVGMITDYYQLMVPSIDDLLKTQEKYTAQLWCQSFATMPLQAPQKLNHLLLQSVKTVDTTEEQRLIDIISNHFKTLLEYQPRFPILRAVGDILIYDSPKLNQFIHTIVGCLNSNPKLRNLESLLLLIKSLPLDMMYPESRSHIAADLLDAAEMTDLFMQSIQPDRNPDSKKANANLRRIERLFIYCLNHLEQLPLVQDKALHINPAECNSQNSCNEAWLLFTAIERKQIEVIQTALECGIDVNGRKRLYSGSETPLIFATSLGNTEIVALLVQHNGQVDFQTETGETALMKAAANGDINTAQLLLEHDADYDAQDEKGYSALMKAAAGGHREMIDVLLDWGADLNLSSVEGYTAFGQAFHNGHKSIAEFLLIKGIDIDPENIDIKEALACGILQQDRKIVELLYKQGVEVDEQGHYGHEVLKLKEQPSRHYPYMNGVIYSGQPLQHTISTRRSTNNSTYLLPTSFHTPSSHQENTNRYSLAKVIQGDRRSLFSKHHDRLDHRLSPHFSEDEHCYSQTLSSQRFTIHK